MKSLQKISKVFTITEIYIEYFAAGLPSFQATPSYLMNYVEKSQLRGRSYTDVVFLLKYGDDYDDWLESTKKEPSSQLRQENVKGAQFILNLFSIHTSNSDSNSATQKCGDNQIRE